MTYKNKSSKTRGLSFQCEVEDKSFTIKCRVHNVVTGVYRYTQINDTQSHHWVMVEPQYQGIGLGTVLVLHAIDQANYMGLGYSADARGYSRDLDAVYNRLIRLGLVDEFQGYFSLTELGKKTLHKG